MEQSRIHVRIMSLIFMCFCVAFATMMIVNIGISRTYFFVGPNSMTLFTLGLALIFAIYFGICSVFGRLDWFKKRQDTS